MVSVRSIASRIRSSLIEESSRLNSANAGAFFRRIARSGTPMRLTIAFSSDRLGGVLRYSMTLGLSPLLSIRAKVFREVLQLGL